MNSSGHYNSYYSSEFYAMNHALITKYNVKIVEIDSARSTYIVSDFKDMNIENDIFVSVSRHSIQQKESSNTVELTEIMMKIRSTNTNLINFVNNIVNEHNKYKDSLTNDKTYHYNLLNFDSSGRPNFRRTILSFKNNKRNLMDHMISNNIKRIKEDIERLNDESYYIKRGLKRKLGYLFYGPPGCGKTSCVSAISDYTKRHIIEVPMSYIKTNQQFEAILNVDYINSEYKVKKEETIMLLDEIDVCESMHNRDNEEKKVECKEIVKTEILDMIKYKDADTFNLGVFLSRIDGITNLDGLIIIGTTNHIEKLDPAIYRDMRMTSIEFTYATKNDIIEMIEKYCEQKIDTDDMKYIPDGNAQLSHAKVRNIIIRNNEKYNNIINELKDYVK
jgi:ATP-dependent Zn protease